MRYPAHMSNDDPIQTEAFKAARAIAGKATQFGAENGNTRNRDMENPVKEWSYREQLRYLAAQDVDPDDIPGELKRLKRTPGNNEKSKLARVIAVRMLEKLYAKAQPALFEKIVDNTEGKLVQTVAEVPPPNKYDFDNMTDEEARQAYADLCKNP